MAEVDYLSHDPIYRWIDLISLSEPVETRRVWARVTDDGWEGVPATLCVDQWSREFWEIEFSFMTTLWLRCFWREDVKT